MKRTKQARHVYSPSHRARSKQYHPQATHSLKAYWPYLPLFLVLMFGLVLNMFIGRQYHTWQGYATNINTDALLADTNGQRTSHNEPALQFNARLASAAQAKAHDMATRQYWSHVTPDGREPWSFIDKTGYQYEAAGENLAYGFGTSDQVIAAWMQSPEHRANVLNADYQDVGFATAKVTNLQGTGPQTIIVALYAEPVGMINADTNSTVSVPVVLTNSTTPVSHLQLLTSAQWAEITVTALAGGALLLFALRHAFAWHKVLAKGERFFLKHPFFDIFLMSAAVLAFLLSHAAGAVL